jgi:hypothetical protein
MAQQLLGLVILLITLPLLFYLTARVRAGRLVELRTLPGVGELPGSVGRSAETGQPLHVSVGVGGVGGTATAHTWAGLTLLSELADEAAACDTPLIVTVADATALPIAQNILRRAYQRNGNPEGYDPTDVRFIAPVPLAYAAGVATLLDQERLSANVMVGSFGLEYVLIGETGADQRLRQIVGAAEPEVLPFVDATADEAMIGEEMFAAGAYTTGLPAQVASLLAEDVFRWLVVAGILVAALFKILVS